MTNAAVTLKFLLMAEDMASKGIKATGNEVDKAGKKMGGFGGAAKIAMAAGGLAVVGFAASSINKFKQVTTESRGLQRALGGTLQEASRLREAAVLSGVDVETFGKSMQKVDKTLVGATANQKTAAAMTKTLGFSFQDAMGHVKPMGELLPKISDKFAAMPDGPEKTALAMKLFGKAGNAMLPFLSKGSAGIAELEKQSDKFGTTIDNKSIKSLAAAKEGQRQWQASMDGLKVTLGAQLLPMMTQFVNFIRDHIIPIVQKITGFLHEHQHAVMLVAIIIGSLVVGLKLWAIAQGILNTVMAMNPIALVVIAVAALAAGIIYAYKHSETFRQVVQGAFAGIRAVALAVWNYALKPILDAWKLQFEIIAGTAMWLWHNIISPVWHGIAAAVSGAWGVIKKVFAYISSGIRGVRDVVKAVGAAIASIWSGIGDGLQAAWNSTVGPILNGIVAAVKGVKDAIDWLTGGSSSVPKSQKNAGQQSNLGHRAGTPHRAGGGPAIAGMPILVGEERPEIFIPPTHGRILHNIGGHHAKSHAGSAHGGTIIIQFRGQSLITEAEVGRAVGKALEYAGNAGTRFHIKKSVVD